MQDHVMSLDHTKSMCIGGISYSLPQYVIPQVDGSLQDETGHFWAWDSAHVRTRLAERHVEVREPGPPPTAPAETDRLVTKREPMKRLLMFTDAHGNMVLFRSVKNVPGWTHRVIINQRAVDWLVRGHKPNAKNAQFFLEKMQAATQAA